LPSDHENRSPNVYVDTHCHIYQSPLCDRIEKVAHRFACAGVQQCLVPAYDRQSWDQMPTQLAHDRYFSAYGIHPWLANEYQGLEQRGEIINDLRPHLDKPRALAIGEIGLDTKTDSSTLANQIPLLESQLELALNLNLPVILHCRGAFDTLLSILANHNHKIRGVLHAYTRGPELGQQLINAGLHLGFGGHITRPEAKRACLSAAALPLDRFVLETDAPNIALAGIPAEQVEPAHIPLIAQAMADLRNVSLKTIADATTANARALFKLPKLESTN